MNSMTIGILIASIVLLALFLIVKAIRRQQEAAREVRQRLGFIKVETVDPALVSRIATIMSPKTGKVKLSKVYKRDQGSHAVYECYVDHENNSDGADQCSVLVGRNWQLPSLKVLPRIGGEGKAWGLLNRLVLMAAERGGYEEVKLDLQPESAQKYTVLSRTPRDIPGKVPADVWRELAVLPEQLFLQAEGDTVVFSSLDEATRRIKGDLTTRLTESLSRTIETGRRLNAIFEAGRVHFGQEPVRS